MSVERWRFVKMQGLGNDFVVLDGIRQQIEVTPGRVRRLADRAFGVGCDQVLVVTPPPVAGVDFGYRIFNADGSEAEQCGNGARCVARFVAEEGLSAQERVRAWTRGGVIELQVLEGGIVAVDMGVPRLRPEEVPFLPDVAEPEAAVEAAALTTAGEVPAIFPLRVGEERVLVSVVSLGNPHAVLVVGDAASAAVQRLGPLIEHHPAFPQGVNVGFAEVRSPNRLRLRVFERGVGETLACGTGGCAAAVAAIRRGLVSGPVEVEMRGGVLTVEWEGVGRGVVMRGPAERVFEGWVEPDRLMERPHWE
ncbi:MAG: diaminopimelate epimerase [Hydrogenophilus sp.]|nr:diaminopimelate epimerase [Hydrogenophilus sp.]